VEKEGAGKLTLFLLARGMEKGFENQEEGGEGRGGDHGRNIVQQRGLNVRRSAVLGKGKKGALGAKESGGRWHVPEKVGECDSFSCRRRTSGCIEMGRQTKRGSEW